jgi:hypothetical protein
VGAKIRSLVVSGFETVGSGATTAGSTRAMSGWFLRAAGLGAAACDERPVQTLPLASKSCHCNQVAQSRHCRSLLGMPPDDAREFLRAFGDAVRARRKERGLLQEAFADRSISTAATSPTSREGRGTLAS